MSMGSSPSCQIRWPPILKEVTVIVSVEIWEWEGSFTELGKFLQLDMALNCLTYIVREVSAVEGIEESATLAAVFCGLPAPLRGNKIPKSTVSFIVPIIRKASSYIMAGYCCSGQAAGNPFCGSGCFQGRGKPPGT